MRDAVAFIVIWIIAAGAISALGLPMFPFS